MKSMLFLGTMLILSIPQSLQAQCSDCGVWENLGGESLLYNVIWTGTRLVGLRADYPGGFLESSEDGLSWTPRNFATTNGLAWNGTTLVASGYSDVSTSTDGLEWSRELQNQLLTYGVFWDGSRFIAHGYRYYLESTDGHHWSKVSFGHNMYLHRGMWDGRSYLATGVNDGATAIITSTDFINFNFYYTEGEEVFSGFESNGKTMVVGGTGRIFVSNNGVDWTIIPLGINVAIRRVLWNGSCFVAFGDYGTLFTSTQGTEWVKVGFGSTSPFTTGYVLNGEFWVNAAPGIWFSSRDGLVWESRSPGTSEAYSLARGEDRVLALQEGMVSVLVDGQAWRSIPISGSLSRAVWDGNRFLALGDSIMTSSDGLAWDVVQADVNLLGVKAIAFGDGVYASVGDQLRFSENGETWEVVEGSFPKKDIVWAGSFFVAVGDHVAIGNRSSWSILKGQEIPSLNAVTFDGHQLVGVGLEGLIVTSPDGRIWTRQASGTSDYLSDISWNGTTLMAVSSSTTLVSQDGIHWHLKNGVGARVTGSQIVPVPHGFTDLFYRITCAEKACEAPPVGVIPWVVNNASWSSRVALHNRAGVAADVLLRAVDQSGTVLEKRVSVAPDAVFAAESADLFPGLSGYSLSFFSEVEALYSSFLTFNREALSGGNSPSQTTGSYVGDLTSKLLFAYLPGDETAAIVLTALEPGQDPVEVELSLFDENRLVATRTISLVGSSPSTHLVKDLFSQIPDHGSIRAQAPVGVNLAGTTFVFNNRRQPSMATAISLKE